MLHTIFCFPPFCLYNILHADTSEHEHAKKNNSPKQFISISYSKFIKIVSEYCSTLDNFSNILLLSCTAIHHHALKKDNWHFLTYAQHADHSHYTANVEEIWHVISKTLLSHKVTCFSILFIIMHIIPKGKFFKQNPFTFFFSFYVLINPSKINHIDISELLNTCSLISELLDLKAPNWSWSIWFCHCAISGILTFIHSLPLKIIGQLFFFSACLICSLILLLLELRWLWTENQFLSSLSKRKKKGVNGNH